MYMKAAFFKNHGNLDQIEVGEIPAPKCGPTEVLVETSYAALNHLDIFVTIGWSGLKLELPHILGSDASGIVKEVGSLVTTVKPGDKVTINPGISCGKCEMCLSGNQNLCSQYHIKGEHVNGTFAELFTIPEINILKIPENFPMDQAAAAPLSYLTAWRMLTTKAPVKQGDYVFIQGGSGGVATCAIQIAKNFGATVIASTSTEEKLKRLREVGADYVINYKDMPDYTGYVFKEITKRHGIDIVVDSVGAATFKNSLRMLKVNGKLVTCGATTGPNSDIALNAVFWKQLEILGSTMSNMREFHEVMKIIFVGKLKAIIGKQFSLDQAKEAEEYLNSGKQFGKVVLKVK